MSKENVEVVRRWYDAYERGDLESGLLAFDPEIEAYDHDIPDSGEYRGFEGLVRWQADWASSWESWRWDPEESTDPTSPWFANMTRLFSRKKWVKLAFTHRQQKHKRGKLVRLPGVRR